MYLFFLVPHYLVMDLASVFFFTSDSYKYLELFYLEELQRLLRLLIHSPTRQDSPRIRASEGGGGCWQKSRKKAQGLDFV